MLRKNSTWEGWGVEPEPAENRWFVCENLGCMSWLGSAGKGSGYTGQVQIAVAEPWSSKPGRVGVEACALPGLQPRSGPGLWVFFWYCGGE